MGARALTSAVWVPLNLALVWSGGLWFALWLAVLGVVAAFELLGLVQRLPLRSLILRLAAGAAAWLYLLGMLACWLLLRQLPNGMERTLAALATVWVADTGAYLVGRAVGRLPFLPAISPRKTVEGTVAGICCAVLLNLAAARWLNLPLITAAMIGLAAGCAAVLGDLMESWLKRRAGAKDSGSILPGHGGVLDRIDSFLLVGAVYYYVLMEGPGA